MTNRFELLVSVFEESVSETAPRLSVSNVPLSAAMHLVLRWPQERRDGVSIEVADRVIPWARVSELWGNLHQLAPPEYGAFRHWYS